MKIFARNFRGFKRLSVDLKGGAFLVGDNSSGKSSILYLIEAITRNDLNSAPQLDEDFGVSRYDYFSPYFDYKPVIFGFIGESNTDKKIAKVVTVEKTERPTPNVVKCTYWVPGWVVRLRAVGNSASVAIVSAPYEIDENELIRLHNSRATFQKNENISSSAIAEVHSLVWCLDISDERDRIIRNQIFSLDVDPCRVTSPVRALPERFYENRRKFDSQGLHFARVWLDLFENNPEVFEYIDQFGQESGLFEKLLVEPVSDQIEDPPLFVSVMRNGRSFSLNQVGVGVSQVIPVLMDSLFSLKVDGHYLLVQQPELHLHPVAQAALGSYFYKMSKLGLRTVLETHSAFFMDRFRSHVRAEQGDSSDRGLRADLQPAMLRPVIIFCEARRDGNRAHSVLIKPDGTIAGEPDSYHKFFVDELLRTMF